MLIVWCLAQFSSMMLYPATEENRSKDLQPSMLGSSGKSMEEGEDRLQEAERSRTPQENDKPNSSVLIRTLRD